MPKEGSVGYSANTPQKQDLFLRLLDWLVGVSRRVMDKHDWVQPVYTYVDLYAGDGVANGHALYALPGSPILALRLLREQQMPTRAVFIEANAEAARSLRQYLYAEPGLQPSALHASGHIHYEDALSTYDLFCHDHTTIMPQLLEVWEQHENLRQAFGLIYADPNGTPCFDLLRQCAERLPHMDLLIHLGANAMKRQRRSPRHAFERVLAEELQQIPKQFWLVRKPESAWQWTFLFGTNWKGLKDWRSQHLYRIDTPMGQQILRELSYTKQEIEGMHGQGSLFAT